MIRDRTLTARGSILRDALAIVDAEFATDLRLDDVAQRVATSRRQLQRCFTDHANTTFREYLTRVRMQQAAELLNTSALTVREVARRVGYRQPAQLAKAFRRQFGVTPRDYRAQARTTGLAARAA